MFLAENLKISLSASIAFDRSNAPRGSPKIRRILGVREYGLSPLLQAERENKSVYSRNDLSFSVGLKVIFFAEANILFAPKLAKQISLGASRISLRSNTTRRRRIELA